MPVPHQQTAAPAARHRLEAMDAWTCPTALLFLTAGNYRDAAGSPLCGIFHKHYKNGMDEVLFINNGHVQIKYKFPAVPIPFHSAMHRWRNLYMMGGFDAADTQGRALSDDAAIFDAVLHRQKPLGVMLLNETKKKKAEDAAGRKGLAIKTAPRAWGLQTDPATGERNFDVWLAQTGELRDLFDLEAVAASYDAMLDAAGNPMKDEMVAMIRGRLKRDARKGLIGILSGYDYGNWGDVDDIMMTGLVLGYPLQSTWDRIFMD